MTAQTVVRAGVQRVQPNRFAQLLDGLFIPLQSL